MEFKPQIQTVLQRYQAFWQRDLLDHPPIRIRYPIEWETGENWMHAVADHQAHFEYWQSILSHRAQLGDDEIPTATVDLAPGLMPGILGAEVIFAHDTSWGSHILDQLEDLSQIPDQVLTTDNHWLQDLRQRIETFERLAKGRCAVGVAMLTGPADIAAALRGVSQLGMDVATSPQLVAKLLQRCTQAFIDVSQAQMDWISSLEGGYCDNYGIWTPGRSSYFADDFSVLVSPEMYTQQLLPYDSAVAASLACPWLHTHSAQARLIPQFLEIPGLVGIQIVNDHPAGPKLWEIVEQLQLIQRRHCLLLRKFTMEDLAKVLPFLSPKGLLVDTQCDSLEQAVDLLAQWKRGRPWQAA